MRNILLSILTVLSLLLIQSCAGSSGDSVSFSDAVNATGPASVISGTASQGVPIAGEVTLKDSKNVTKTGLIDPATGAYSIAVHDMTAPFILKAGSFYSASATATTTNINPFTDLCIKSAAAAGTTTVDAIFADPALYPSNLVSNLNAIAAALNLNIDELYPLSVPATQRDFLKGSLVTGHGVDLVLGLVSIVSTSGNTSIDYNQQVLLSVTATATKLSLIPNKSTFTTLASAIQTATQTIVAMETNLGTIKIALYKTDVPISSSNFLAYVNSGFYSNTIFHRVIPGFMIQGGGFTSDLKQKATNPPIINEAANGLKNLRGTIAMARTSVIDSATSQFFINVADNSSNDYTSATSYGYAVFGHVVEGMDIVDKIAAVATGVSNGMENVPVVPVVITSVTVVP